MINNSKTISLRKIFQLDRWQILFTYFLTIIENLFELLYPWAVGIAINGLLQGKYITLLPLFSAWLAHIITGLFRQVYDTKVFTKIYTKLVTSVILGQDRRGVNTSRIVARSYLSRELVDFFERDMPNLITALFGFFGALIMLFIYDFYIGVYCTALLIPLIVINIFYSRRSRCLNSQLNDRLEQEVDILSNRQENAIVNHYGSLRKWRIRLSNAEAKNWGTIQFMVMGIAVAVLLRTVKLPGINTGEIYAIISYFFSYLESLDKIPFLVQQFSRLEDIGERITTN